MVFKTSRKVLMLPLGLGTLNLLLGGGLLLARAAAGTLRLDFETVGAAVIMIMGGFFLQVALKLSRYTIEATETAMVVGPGRPGDPGRELPWSEIDKLVRQETPARGRRAPNMIYRVQAGKRHLAFTSLLFEEHEQLAGLVAERSGCTWEQDAKASSK